MIQIRISPPKNIAFCRILIQRHEVEPQFRLLWCDANFHSESVNQSVKANRRLLLSRCQTMVKFRYFLKNWNLALKDDSFLAFLTEVGVPGPTHQAAKAHRATHRPPLLFRGRSISSFFISFVAPPPSLTTPLHLPPGPPLAKREAAGRYHNGTSEKNGGLLTRVRGSDPALLFFALTPRLLLPHSGV